MTPATFKRHLQKLGFTLTQNSLTLWRFQRRISGVLHSVERDSVKGSAWRLHLAIGEVPEIWPAWGPFTPQTWIQAESPWFYYHHDDDPDDPLPSELDTPQTALQKCLDWFKTIGLQWLSNPDKLSDDDWRVQHDVLVRRPETQ